MQFNIDIINLFLEMKDIMQEQFDVYKNFEELDVVSFEYICNVLCQLVLEVKGEIMLVVVEIVVLSVVIQEESVVEIELFCDESKLCIVFLWLKVNEVDLFEEELGNLVILMDVVKGVDLLLVILDGSVVEDDIVVVFCFVIEVDQIVFEKVVVVLVEKV